MPSPLVSWRWVAALIGMALWPGAAPGQGSGGATAQVEDRVALVIGNAAYRQDPLDNPVNDARLIAARLRQAGFKVTLQENLERRAMTDALRGFGDQLRENTVALLYYAGHGLQVRDRNYLIPVDAELRGEDDIRLQGIDLGIVLERMARARSRVNLVILDACRDNPFAGRSGSAASGLAQMDAPVGTLLAFATAPGKQAPDSLGPPGHSAYSAQLAAHLLTPGLPVELMFKRVRQAVVAQTRRLQIPWESSSLQGEFAFVPGHAGASEAAGDAALEAALWERVQGSARADDLRSYLRQYPDGRQRELALARIAALARPAPGAASAATAVPEGTAEEARPRVGDRWRYRVSGELRFGEMFFTAQIEAVGPEGVSESWTTTADAKVRRALAPARPGFSRLPDWNAAPPEFAPYLSAAATPALAPQRLEIDGKPVVLHAAWQGLEDVVVTAGRFKAHKLVLRTAPAPRGTSQLSAEVRVWYAAAVKRIVKYEVQAQTGRLRHEATTFELTEYELH